MNCMLCHIVCDRETVFCCHQFLRMAISRWKTAHFITIIGFVTVWHEEKCSGFGLATTINCWRCIWSMFSICCCCWLLAFHNVYFSVCSMSLELLWEIYNDFCITSFSYWSTHRMQFYTDSKYGRMPMALTQWATNKERIGDKHVCLQSTPIQGILENEHFIEYRHPQHSTHTHSICIFCCLCTIELELELKFLFAFFDMHWKSFNTNRAPLQ